MKQFLTAFGFLLVGIVAIVGLLSVGRSITPAFNGAAASLSSAFKPAPKFDINIDSENINSDRLFAINTSTPDDSGEYKVSYPCNDGVSVKQGRGNYIPCGEETTVAVSNQKIDDLIITSTKENFKNIPMTVFYTDSKTSKTAHRTVDITVVNNDITKNIAINTEDNKEDDDTKTTELEKPTDKVKTEPVITPKKVAKPAVKPAAKPVPQYTKKIVKVVVPREATSKVNGVPNLVPYTSKVGKLGVGQTFIPKAAFTDEDQVLVVFSVENVGTKVVNTPWSVRVTSGNKLLATQSNHDVLYPDGSRVNFNLVFDAKDVTIVNGMAHITFTVDSSNTLAESSEIDNTISLVVTFI